LPSTARCGSKGAAPSAPPRANLFVMRCTTRALLFATIAAGAAPLAA
jgi:hypothetical protein